MLYVIGFLIVFFFCFIISIILKTEIHVFERSLISMSKTSKFEKHLEGKPSLGRLMFLIAIEMRKKGNI